MRAPAPLLSFARFRRIDRSNQGDSRNLRRSDTPTRVFRASSRAILPLQKPVVRSSETAHSAATPSSPLSE
jgi:hypothetical protein